MPPKRKQPRRKASTSAAKKRKQKNDVRDLTTLPSNFSDMYIEITDEKFQMGAGRVKKQPYLSDEWTTKHIYRIPSYLAGTYLMFNLHKNPHYSLPFSSRNEIESKAKAKKVDIVNIPKGDFEVPNEIYHFSNDSTTYKQHILPHKAKFQLDHVIDFLDNKKKGDRGNYAKQVGWHNTSLLGDKQLSTPIRSKINSFDKSILGLMTNVMKNIYKDKIDDIPFSKNARRGKEFAQVLMDCNDNQKEEQIEVTHDDNDQNVFEALTYAMTFCNSHEPDRLLNHIDSLNDRIENFNSVFAIYFHTYHPTKPDNIVRVVFIGYSRKAIHDYYKRENNCEVYKKHLLKYYDCLKKTGRQDFTIQNAFDWNPTSTHILHARIPFIDKCAFYSIFVSPIYDLIKTYKVKKQKIFIEDILEMVMPIGWLTTGSNYYLIIKNWEENGLPEGCLSIKLLEELREIGGGISAGSGPRMQPHQNTPIPISKIYGNLRYLKQLVDDANNLNEHFDEYTTMMKNNLYGIGYLGAQHILSVLSLLRILENPEYVQKTVLCQNTETEKSLIKTYRLRYGTVNKLYQTIAQEKFNLSTRIVENLGCEFLRDIKTPMDDWNEETVLQAQQKRYTRNGIIKHPDLFYSTQAIFIEDGLVITRHAYTPGGRIVQTVLPISSLSHDYHRLGKWDENEEGSIEVKTDKPAAKPIQTETDVKACKFFDSLEDMDHKYSTRQKTLLWQYYTWHNCMPSSTSHFVNDNEWFQGKILRVDTTHVVKVLTNASKGTKGKKKGKKKKTKKNIIKFKAVKDDENDVYYYTSYILGKDKRIYLSSQYQICNEYGFVKYIVENDDTSGTDSVAYYNSRENAVLALKLRIFCDPKYSILKYEDITATMNDQKFIAIVDRHENGDKLWGFLFLDEFNCLAIPTTANDSELLHPWETFILE